MDEQAPAEPVDPVRAIDELFASVNRSDAPGVVVGVAHEGKRLYARAFGLASLEHGIVNSVKTRMRIGSTSKHFTCLAVLLLAEDGKLDVDAGVRTYIPELPASLGDPTLRQLMSHQGGYRCYLDVGMIGDNIALKPVGNALATQIRQSTVNFPAGERAIYNNGGYHLLSIVVDRQAGMSFERFVDERVFTPLGMIDTRWVPNDLEIHRGLATLYMALPDGGYRRGVFPAEEIRGEGSMISTVDDMLRWLAHFRHPDKVGSAATWAQMTRKPTMNNGFVSGYALGLMVDTVRGVNVIHHAGGVMGGACQMLTVPDHALDIIVITNGAPANPVELAEKIVGIVLAEQLQPAAEPLKAADYARLLGTYHSPKSGLVFKVSDEKGALSLSPVGGPPVPMQLTDGVLAVPFSKTAIGHFEIPIPSLAADAGPVDCLVIKDFGNEDVLERVPETPSSVAVSIEGIDGVFDVPDAEGYATLAGSDPIKLTIKGAYGSSVLKLTPLAEDLFTFEPAEGLIPLMGVVQLQRVDGKVSGLTLHTGRTRGLRMYRR